MLLPVNANDVVQQAHIYFGVSIMRHVPQKHKFSRHHSRFFAWCPIVMKRVPFQENDVSSRTRKVF